ncbi:MAG TPA: mannosyltransferase family protein, partial [Anaerolineae bacterium]|nr:mannosyltransferase family protein [Anaerolineae bacterium]
MLRKVTSPSLSSPIWFDVFLPFFLSRLGIFVTGQLALAWGVLRPEAWGFSNRPWIDMWARWDSGWYLNIVTRGYDYVPGQQSNVVFFPLYPYLIRLFSIGSQDRDVQIVTGWVVSNAFALLAFYLLYQLILLDAGPDVGRRAIWLLAFFPTSFFFSVVYTESLFLALTVGAFYVARKRRWLAAGLLGGLGAVTRVTGAFLILPLAWEWYQQKPRRWSSAWSLMLIPLGLGAYMVYLGRNFGDPLAFSAAQFHFGRSVSIPAILDSIKSMVTDPGPFLRGRQVTPIELSFVFLAIFLLVVVFQRQRLSYALYVSYAIAVPLASIQTISFSRYILVAFPLFIAMAQILYRPMLFRLAL